MIFVRGGFFHVIDQKLLISFPCLNVLSTGLNHVMEILVETYDGVSLEEPFAGYVPEGPLLPFGVPRIFPWVVILRSGDELVEFPTSL